MALEMWTSNCNARAERKWNAVPQQYCAGQPSVFQKILDACLMKFSSPSFNEIELTTPLP